MEWMESSLSDRTQSVVIDGKQSEAVKISIGVPQGSVLAPLLFLVCTKSSAGMRVSSITAMQMTGSYTSTS